MFNGWDPLALGLIVGAFSLIPAFLLTSTCFLKVSIVLNLVRNAIGVQQVPPNIALYGIALILTAYIMSPVMTKIVSRMENINLGDSQNVVQLIHNVRESAEPLREFLIKNARVAQRSFFLTSAKKLAGSSSEKINLRSDDFEILIPAFVVSEITDAFEVGFLIYLPFLIVDLVVSNLLLALGMMMVSPVMISLPLKLFLFVMIDGWTRLLHGLILSYV